VLRIGPLGLLEVNNRKHDKLLTFKDDVWHGLGRSTASAANTNAGFY